MHKVFIPIFLFACASPEGTPSANAVRAVVDPDRTEHFFDAPFPDDAWVDSAGHVDLSSFPESPSEVLRDVVVGWARRIGQTSQGFANHGAAYFRFEGPLDVPAALTGAVDDPVLLIDTSTGERIPLALRFYDHADGDPFVADNLLAFAPALGHPPASGATLAAVVMESAGARSAEGWSASDAVMDALEMAGVSGAPAVATVFTIQDATGELASLYQDVDQQMGERPDWSAVDFKRMVELDFAPGTTPSGEDTTAVTVTFEDGTSESVNMYFNEEGTHSHDLLNDWPMAVYQAEIPVYNYSGLADQPYMSPGFAHLFDTERETGWIDFTNGVPAHAPDEEPMRIILSLPKDDAGNPIENAPIVMWDHGTGGSAINSVQRINQNDDGFSLATRFAEAGFAVIGRDAPLYGKRFDLIDAGYSGGSLGFYNVVNLPAFRDNQRQTAVDGHVLRRFIAEGLNAALSAGSIDTDRVRRLGHSLGSVTTNLGVAPEPEAYESVFLSGTGGVLSHYFLDTGLIEDLGNELVDQIFGLFQVDAPDPITAPSVLGAALGIPEEGWGHIDRLHPTMTLFQWIMDPSDPMSVARDETAPTTVFIGIGDHQVPNFTSHALHTALPNSSVITVPANGDYDPHYVLHREPAGFDALSEWLSD